MLTKRRPARSFGEQVAFFKEFLKHPQQVASIVPSSRFLERRVAEIADVQTASTIVELGAGTGGVTRAILGAMPADARLLSLEINSRFASVLQRTPDPRLTVHAGSAEELQWALRWYQLPAPDVVVSGIPFSKIPRDTASQILRTIAHVLVPGGRFVAYQWHNRVAVLGRPLLGPASVDVELRNLPPLRIFSWQKQVEAEGCR
jgi:phospholipid N-methyltransferase